MEEEIKEELCNPLDDIIPDYGKEVILESINSIDEVYNIISKFMDLTDLFHNGSKELIGRVKESYGYNKIIGRMSNNNLFRWRIDYDVVHGPHLHIESFIDGKGLMSKKALIPINIMYSDYLCIIDKLNSCKVLRNSYK